MNEDFVRLRARMIALEYLILNLYDQFHRSTSATRQQVRQAIGRLRLSLAHATFPGEDPALSDLMAAEVQSQADQLLSALEQMEQGRRSV